MNPAQTLLRLAILSGAMVTPALAQVANVSPYYGIVTADKATLKASDFDLAYAVGSVTRGIVLVVDGEGSGWARVSYPAGSTSFVKASSATLDEATKTVKLTEPSQLKAASTSGGLDNSWKSALTSALPPGSTLKYIESIREKDGTVTGYRVAAPEAARAFMELNSIRRATQDEVSAFRSKPGAYLPEVSGMSAPTASATPAAAPKTTPPPADKPAEKVDASLVKPPVPGANTGAPTNPVTSPETVPPTAAPVTATPSTTPPTADPTGTPTATPAAAPADGSTTMTPGGTPTGTPAPTDVPEIKPREIPAPTGPTAESLEPTFQRIIKQGGSNEECAELIGQYNELLAKQEADRFGQRRRMQIQNRIDVLNIKINMQQSASEAQAQAQAVQAANMQVQQTLSAIDAARVYGIVGTLSASNVYNGTNLPLMYRVQANDGTARTLGYIKPDALPNLASMLGKTVGVVGEQGLDETLKLNVIRAVRVDPITIMPAAPSPMSTPAATPAATPSK